MKKIIGLLFAFIFTFSVYADVVSDYITAIENGFNRAQSQKTLVMADNECDYDNDDIELNLIKSQNVVYSTIEIKRNTWACIYIQYSNLEDATKVFDFLIKNTENLKGSQKTLTTILEYMGANTITPVSGKYDKYDMIIYTNVALSDI